jgi:hypothetical protein
VRKPDFEVATKAGQNGGFARFFAGFSCTLPAGSRPVFSQLLHVRIRLDAASEIYFGNCPAHGGGVDPMLQKEPSKFATASGI